VCLLCLIGLTLSSSLADEPKTILSDDFLTMPGDDLPALREYVTRLTDYQLQSMEEYDQWLRNVETYYTSLRDASEKLMALSDDTNDIVLGQKSKLIAIENLNNYTRSDVYALQLREYAEELIRDFPGSNSAIYAQAVLLELRYNELQRNIFIKVQGTKEEFLQQMKEANAEWLVLEKQMKEFHEKHSGVKASEILSSLALGPCSFEEETDMKKLEAFKDYLKQSELPEAKELLERMDYAVQNTLAVKYAIRFMRLYKYAGDDEQAQDEVRRDYRKVIDAKKEEFESDKENSAIRHYYIDMLESALGLFGKEEWLMEHFDGVKQYYLSSNDPEMKARAERLDGVIRRKTIEGNEMEFEALKLDGTKIDIRDFRGKVVLIDYWATWCGPCIASFPLVEKLYDEYHDQGFEVIAYSIDEDLDTLRDYEKKHSHPWISTSQQLTLDKGGREFSDYYGITGIPSYMLIGRDGKVISAATYPEGEDFSEMFKKALAAEK